MAVLLGRRSPIAGWAKRAMPTAAQFLHENPNEMTLLEMLGSTNLRKSSPEDYRVLRDIVNTFERYSGVGNDIQLTLAEHSANELIMGEKKREYEKGIMDPSKFAPGHHIFQVLHTVKKSPLFQMLRKMPKGAALKTHDTSMCSSRAVIEMTYRENLWVCTTHKGCRVEEFRFAAEKPKDMRHKDGEWQPMEKLRELRGEENLRKYLRVRLSMYPLSSFRTNAHAWDHMMGIFTLLDGLLQYAPLWGDYYYRALEEFYADGVQYLEVRTVVPQLYCLDGSRLPQRETVQIYLDTLERFKKEHPGFIDSKLIYAPLRHVQPEVVGQYVKQCTELNKEFPDFVVGFDLVGQEDKGHPLSKFAEELLKLPEHIDFYFHAGQTNWYGSHVDQNLLDAIVLGTKRISHGYTITKHPLLMRLAKYLNIALEVCPVSNQVLQLGSDYRNHPAATLIAANVPMVISSGNPAFWRAAPLSHDFYMAFLGIAPMNADLKFLKRTAKNSIRYSSLSDEAKAEAMEKWKKEWDEWVEKIVDPKENVSEEENK
ncbi:adenosine deaminase 2 isoform X1 [Drosophila takahashii]|uniref:adenosine deaminase 2 isoform X1 n=1 Tax=Drosophila takahashii TaxID=29030 RepID=UPI001CF8029F|nr:adenosine deaminase 2 [Drosophila takahashii]